MRQIFLRLTFLKIMGYKRNEPFQAIAANTKYEVLWRDSPNMLITHCRRTFPALRIQIQGLDPLARYCVLLELSPRSDCRYKYNGGTGSGWSRAGSAEPHSPHRVYLHPDSPATGAHWMAQTVNFNRLKLTNSAIPHPGNVVLSSMHKYQPKIIIVQAPDPRALPWAPATTVSFPETEFIAVTAYQNDKITKLKIDNNPFAKGFRENGQSRCKRKRTQQDESSTQEEVLLKKSCTSSDNSTISSPGTSPIPQQEVHIPSPINYQPSNAWTDFYTSPVFPCSVNCPCLEYEQINYYIPQTFAYAYNYPQYYCYSNQHTQDLSISVPKPKTLTDFSIRAIIES